MSNPFMPLNDKDSPVSDNLEIIYCDNHLLVINKPAGTLVQRDKTGDESLLDSARAYIKERYDKPGNVYLGLVHRLDRPVSGVVVFARTSKAAARLSRQFREKKTEKIYKAIVEGEAPTEGCWVDHIARRGATSYISENGEGGRADLHFSRLSHKNGLSLVRIKLGTGRHHQIRVQFASRGYPVLGDFRYGSHQKFGNRAIALHAFALTLVHPTTKEEMTFTADPPPHWQSCFPLIFEKKGF